MRSFLGGVHMCPVWIWKPTVSLTEEETMSVLIFYCIIVAVSTDRLSSFCLWPFCLSYVTFSRPCCLCDVYSSQSLKNVVTKAVRPCPCDWCVFEKRCFFGKKKNWQKALCPQIYLLSNRNVLMCKETSWINACNWQSVHSDSLSRYGEKHNNILLCWWYKELLNVGDN